jgi:two-component system, NtrC family, sensor histidine kinase HydH
VESLFDELKRYVGFGAADEVALRGLHPVVAPAFPQIAEVFYDRILAHEEARRVLESGESQVGRLKMSLLAWMEKLFQGPWDAEYFELRCRIGRIHVRIALPQHYMFGAMSVIRQELNARVDAHHAAHPPELAAARAALGKILDLELAIMLHTYREDLEAQQELTRRAHFAEKLAALGTMAAGFAHEIRNPLNAAHLQLKLAERSLRSGQTRELDAALDSLALVRTEMERLNGIVTESLAFARPASLNPVAHDMAQTVTTVARFLAPEIASAGVTLHVNGAEETIEVSHDEGHVKQVLINLIRNATDAAGKGGEVWVSVRRAGPMIELKVEDTGPGVPPEVDPFVPYFTTKDRGTGLGLPLAHRIMTDHGGTLYLSRTASRTTFVAELPISRAAPPSIPY